MYTRILLPTDGSTESREALPHALDIATAFDAALHVLYVVDTDVLPLDAHAQSIVEAADEEARQSVAELVDQAEERGIDPAVGALRRGRPHEVILTYVDDHDIDLVVMGTHGRRGLGRYLIGSVTERVVRLADVPVLAVHRTPDGGT